MTPTFEAKLPGTVPSAIGNLEFRENIPHTGRLLCLVKDDEVTSILAVRYQLLPFALALILEAEEIPMPKAQINEAGKEKGAIISLDNLIQFYLRQIQQALKAKQEEKSEQIRRAEN